MRREDGERFTLSLRVTSEGLYFYRFVVRCGGADTAFYADSELNAREGKGDEWQLTVYDEVYAAPSFLDGGIIYQIFPDRFNIGGERLKTKPGAVYRDDTYGTPYYKADEKGIVPNNDFFGGNLDGVTEKLDYLKSLGVKCVYLNPIFEAASNHKYDTGSYRRIDGDFGGEAAFRRLISAANERESRLFSTECSRTRATTACTSTATGITTAWARFSRTAVRTSRGTALTTMEATSAGGE